jgi:hypothetical protein
MLQEVVQGMDRKVTGKATAFPIRHSTVAVLKLYRATFAVRIRNLSC